MAEEEKKKPKRPRKLDRLSKELGEKTAIDFGSERYKQAREAGATRRSALRESVSRYGEAGEAMRTIRTGRKGGAAEFFEAAGFDSLSKIAGSLFDKKATKEEVAEARKTLGLEPEKEEKTKEKSLEKGIVKTSAEMIKKIKSLEENVKVIDAKVSYIAERVSPKIIEAKQEGGEAITVVRYDPLAPAGEQFRQVSGKGKASALKPAKEFIKSAVMKAATADTGMMPNLKGSVSKYKDPEEKSFTEEFKKDPILVLRKDMNDNFEKVFKLLEEQKKTMGEMSSGSLLDSLGSLLGGGALGGAVGRMGRKPKPTTPKPKGAIARTAARVGGTVTAGAAATGAAIKTAAKKTAEKVGGTAAGKAATKAAEKVGDVKSKTWTRFLKFMEKVSPKIYKKAAARLATAGGLALIPGAGWIGSAITVLGSAWLAYDVYQLWSDFTNMSEEEQAEFDKEPETSGDKRGMEIPSQSGAVEGRAGGTTEIPAQYGTTPAPATAERVTPTGRPVEKEGIISRGFSAVKSFFGVGGGEKEQNFGNQKPAPTKKISNSEGKKAVIASMDKKGITDKTQRAAILAQVAHESGGFTMLSENLNYSAPNLVKIFSYYKRNPEEASIDAKNPVAIGSKAYGNRLGNGPPPTGEGYEFRGRGFIQLTGRANYDRFGITNPDELLNTQKAADNAVDFMLGYRGDWNDVGAVTKYVNGPAQLGLGERESYFQSFLADPDVAGTGEASTAGGESSGGAAVAAAPSGGAVPPAPAVGGSAESIGGVAATGGGGGAPVASSSPEDKFAAAGAEYNKQIEQEIAAYEAAQTSPSPETQAALDQERKLVGSGIVQPSPGGMEIPAQSLDLETQADIAERESLGDPLLEGDEYDMIAPVEETVAAYEAEQQKPSLLGSIGGIANKVGGLASLFGKSDIASKASNISAITGMLGGGMVPGLGAVPMPYGSVGLGGQDGGLGLLSKVGEVAGSMQQISALASPIFNKTGDSIDRGSKEIEAGKTEMAMAQPAPVVINNNSTSTKQSGQQGASLKSALGEAGARSSESAFMRAIAKDFSHPTAFTTIGTI